MSFLLRVPEAFVAVLLISTSLVLYACDEGLFPRTRSGKVAVLNHSLTESQTAKGS